VIFVLVERSAHLQGETNTAPAKVAVASTLAPLENLSENRLRRERGLSSQAIFGLTNQILGETLEPVELM